MHPHEEIPVIWKANVEFKDGTTCTIIGDGWHNNSTFKRLFADKYLQNVESYEVRSEPDPYDLYLLVR